MHSQNLNYQFQLGLRMRPSMETRRVHQGVKVRQLDRRKNQRRRLEAKPTKLRLWTETAETQHCTKIMLNQHVGNKFRQLEDNSVWKKKRRWYLFAAVMYYKDYNSSPSEESTMLGCWCNETVCVYISCVFLKHLAAGETSWHLSPSRYLFNLSSYVGDLSPVTCGNKSETFCSFDDFFFSYRNLSLRRCHQTLCTNTLGLSSFRHINLLAVITLVQTPIQGDLYGQSHIWSLWHQPWSELTIFVALYRATQLPV